MKICHIRIVKKKKRVCINWIATEKLAGEEEDKDIDSCQSIQRLLGRDIRLILHVSKDEDRAMDRTESGSNLQQI